ESKLVVAVAAGARVALDGALRLLRGERVRRHVGAVVEPPGDHRPIGVALEEVDDHLVSDPGDVDRSPRGARPDLAHADPARAPLVALALAVPVELHLHAAVLVRVDLLARWTDDDRRLDTTDDGPPRPVRGPERHVVGDALELVLV